MSNNKIEFKMSNRQKKLIIIDFIIVIFLVVFLIISRIFNLDDNIVIKILNTCVLITIVILNIIVFIAK